MSTAVPQKVIDALHARPDDDAPLVAFADELSHAGDVRGELAVLVAQRKLKPMMHFLLMHAAKLFGPAEPFVHDGVIDELGWAPGFVRRATIHEAEDASASVADVTRALLASPAGCLVRALEIPELGEASSEELLAALATHQAPKLIDTLIIDDHLDAFGALWKVIPAVRHLAVRGIAQDVTGFSTRRLEALSWLDTAFERDVVKALLKLKWPALERLELRPVDDEEGAVEQAGLLEFLDKVDAPRLSHLALRNFRLDEDDVGALFESERFEHLESLDLGHCEVLPEAAVVVFEAESNFGEVKVCLPGDFAEELPECANPVWPGLIRSR